MNFKTTLIELLREAAADERAFMDGLSAEQRARQGQPEAWAPKDVIAHFAAWEVHGAEELRRLLEDRPLEPEEDDDTANARIFAERRDWSWDEVRAYALAAKVDYEHLIEELDEAQLTDAQVLSLEDGRPIWRHIIGDVYTHPLIHLAEQYRDDGDLERAAALVGRMTAAVATLDDSPEWQGLSRYNLACSYALFGKVEEAIAELGAALALNPALRDWSRQDKDLAALHGRPEYEALYV